MLIIGFGPAQVTPLTLLWLAAVASGVLARGGREHWVGRALLLVALALPIARHQTLKPAVMPACAWPRSRCCSPAAGSPRSCA